MKQPLVSVLLPCYNVEKYIEESLQSILNQTYRNLEIIAINDCSQDHTEQILNRMAAIDHRIKVINNEQNLKLIKTLNKGITHCLGEYIARMDGDDIALPTRIEKEVAFLETHTDHDIVSTQFQVFRSDKPNKFDLHHNPTLDEDLRAYILFKSGICHPAVMMRKRLFTELNLKFENEYLHVEDYALWSKAIYKTKIGNLDEALLLYRVHPEQVSTKHEQLQIENKKKVFKIHCQHLGLPTDDHYLDIYLSVAECVPMHSSIDFLMKCEQFMLSIIDLNKHTNFCNNQYLNQMMAMHWLRLCANSQLGFKTAKLAKQSKLYQKKYYSLRDFVIFYTKCTFRIEYKKSFIYKMLLE